MPIQNRPGEQLPHPSRRRHVIKVRHSLLACVLIVLALPGCDMLGIESSSAINARKEADGRGAGAACRQADRSLEECFAMYERSPKAAIHAGWIEMSDYMRENQATAQKGAPGGPVKAEEQAQGEQAAPN